LRIANCGLNGNDNDNGNDNGNEHLAAGLARRVLSI
jgi:hypothetical protein